MRLYIHQQEAWPEFTWNSEDILDLPGKALTTCLVEAAGRETTSYALIREQVPAAGSAIAVRKVSSGMLAIIMQKIAPLSILLWCCLKASAQPVDTEVIFDETQFVKPFLHCVPNKAYFAQYAVEAHSPIMNTKDTIHCKLYIPMGLDRVWEDTEKSGRYASGAFDYSGESMVDIQWNFYVNSIPVASAYTGFKRNPEEPTTFAHYFDIVPGEHLQGDDVNLAYNQMLRYLKRPFNQVYIQAVLTARQGQANPLAHIATASFLLEVDSLKYPETKNPPKQTNKSNLQDSGKVKTDFNQRLKYLADSTMIRHFGLVGFKRNFMMSCLQNPCMQGFAHANILETGNPCSDGPQDTCKEAVVTYNYVKQGVPLAIKMLVVMQEAGEYVYIKNNQFGTNEISLQQQNLLTTEAMRAQIRRQFPRDSLWMPTDNRALIYVTSGILRAVLKKEATTGRGHRTDRIKMSGAGKKWDGGFIYTAYGRKSPGILKVYQFDATTGRLLWVESIVKIHVVN
jgi:hypothetical protein